MIDAFLKVSDTGSRRDLFRSFGLVALGGGSAAVLAACSGSGPAHSAGSPAGGSSAAGSPSAGGSSSAAGGSSASGELTIAKSAVPSGSGMIKKGFIVTQPSAGQFKAFSNICTHQGCPISDISGATIMCNCHGSEFNLDGSVKRGPASRPLTAAKITEKGNNLDVSGS